MPKRTRGRVPADAADVLPPPTSRPFLLLWLFVVSGAAALIYEVVWFQMLPLVIGSSFVSLGTVLAAFMGGMGLGSLLAPRLAGARHPLRVYAALEVGIAACGLAVLWGLPLMSALYTGLGGGSLAVRAAIAGICLVPPAMLMGATLPVVARLDSTPARLGAIYAANLIGAVAGSLLAGFYLLRAHDVAIATYVAVAFNLLVAAAAWRLAGQAPRDATPVRTIHASSPHPLASAAVMFAMAISGFTALASQAIWTRQLGLVFGATVYAFSLILAVFLAGLGLGSSLGTALVRIWPRPHVALGWCQLLLAGAAIGAARLLSGSIPYWPVEEPVASGALLVAQADVIRCAMVVLPGAILWGASFPLAVSAVARQDHDPATFVGRLYAANTFGAVAGAVAANLMIGAFGSHVAERAIVVLLVLSAIALLVAASPRRLAPVLAAGAAAIGMLLLLPAIPRVPGELIAYGR